MKKWYQSKTIWTGVIFIVYGFLAQLGVVSGTPSDTVITYALSVIMILLRLVTKEPISFKKS